MTLQDFAKMIESTSNEEFSIKSDGSTVFTCDSGSLKGDHEEEEFAFECALLLEREIDYQAFEDRWGKHLWQTMPMGEEGYDYDHLVTGDWWCRKNGLTDVRDTFRFKVDIRRLFSNLEESRILIDFDCNWLMCSSCCKGFRACADCYSWVPSVAIVQDDWECKKCILENGAREYLEQLHNDSDAILRFDWDLSTMGYTRVAGNFSSGLHKHQNDIPSDIMESVRSATQLPNLLFKQTSTGQFGMDYELWTPSHEVALEKDGLAVKGIGMTPAGMRFIKVTRDYTVEFISIEDFLWGVNPWSEDGGNLNAVLMTLEEGESVSVIEEEDTIHITRITEKCFDSQSA
jgi:hypothetical protein